MILTYRLHEIIIFLSLNIYKIRGSIMAIYVKQLISEDWKIFREIRLLALKESPSAFGGSYEKEFKYSESKWRDPLSLKDRAAFVLFDDEKSIGLGFVRVFDERPDEAGLFMGYIAKEHRGLGLSKKLYQARIDWAIDKPAIKTIVTYNKSSNMAAQRMNKGFGFKLTESLPRDDWPDGSVDDELKFELRLEKLRI
jgi:RimJ/RimL family protein N-acetyltransferase